MQQVIPKMKLIQLISKAFKAGASPLANESLLPYFWGCVLWLSIASAVIPFLSYGESIGGVVFFVIMTSLLTHDGENRRKIPSWSVVAKRSGNVILTSLISAIIILIGMLMLVIPGVIASKQLIYSGLIAAKDNVSPIQALKTSRKLSKVNGYTLLGGTLLLALPLVLVANPEIFIGPLLWSLDLGRFGTIAVKVIFNILFAWLSYIVLNHMLLIAYKEAAHQETN